MVQMWHSFWMNYNGVLLDSCNCEKERARLVDKIMYHRMKVHI
jgi:hypothetical protein